MVLIETFIDDDDNNNKSFLLGKPDFSGTEVEQVLTNLSAPRSPTTSEMSEAVRTFFALFEKGSDRSFIRGGSTIEVSRQRHRVTPHQLLELEKMFLVNSRPEFSVKKHTSDQLKMPLKSVSIWFQNRRAKQRNGGEFYKEKLICSESSDRVSFLGSDEGSSTLDQENSLPSDFHERGGGGNDSGSRSSFSSLTEQVLGCCTEIQSIKTVEEVVPSIFMEFPETKLSSPIILHGDEDALVEHTIIPLETMDSVWGEEGGLPVDEKMRIWEASNMLVYLRRVSSPDSTEIDEGFHLSDEKMYPPRSVVIQPKLDSIESLFHCKVEGCDRSFEKKSRRRLHYSKAHKLSELQIYNYDSREHRKEMSPIV